MRNKSRFLALVSLLFAVALYAHHGPASVTIKAAANKQPAVVFPHDAHTKRAKCDTCHHTQKGLTTDAGTKVVPCTTCHLDPKDPKIPSMREMSMTKNPFHIRCIGCHKTEKKGPTVCTQCHKKG